jgi:hypothetical protein
VEGITGGTFTVIAGGGLAGIGGGALPGSALHPAGGRVCLAAVSAALRNLDISRLLSGVSEACQPSAYDMVSCCQHDMPDITSTPYDSAICRIALVWSSNSDGNFQRDPVPGITNTKKSYS